MKKNKSTKKDVTTAENLEARFNDRKKVLDYFEGGEVQRVNVDIPVWAVNALDREAERIGVARQALIKVWIVSRLDEILRKNESSSL